MGKEYWIAILIFGTMLFKAFANATNYWYNKAEEESRQKKIYGVLNHIFEIFMIVTPTLAAPLVFDMPWDSYSLAMTGATLIYFGFFNNLYNRLIGKPPQYLGKVDLVDRALRWFFKIDKDPGDPAKNKNIVLWMRAILGIFGMAIILSILVI